MKQEAPHVSTEALLAIEEALQEPCFFNVSVGTTLNDRLITKLANGYRVWDLKSVCKDLVRYYYHRWVATCKGSSDYSHMANSLCVTWLFDRFDLKGFVLPIIDAYGEENTFVMGPSKSMADQLPTGTKLILWDDLPKINMLKWRREFDRCAPDWKQNLTDVLTKYNISRSIVILLMDTLQVQTQLIMAFSRFLELARPCAIVTEYDRNGHASCLILAAKERNIPCYTMIHGALDPYPSFGFTPLLADYACCWGERHRIQMLELGASSDSLIVTGCQRLSQTIVANRGEAILKAGLSTDNPIVMLITNPIKPKDKKQYVRAFCLGVLDIENITAVVRLHPAEYLSEYQELIQRFPSVTFMANDTWSQDESLAAVDIVVNHDSSFGNDALVKRRLVVILDVLSFPLNNGKELIEMAGCPCARNSEELRCTIECILSDESFRRDLRKSGDNYVQMYCDAFGDDAAQNIVQSIRQTLEEKK